jgi:hypothetical protein
MENIYIIQSYAAQVTCETVAQVYPLVFGVRLFELSSMLY